MRISLVCALERWRTAFHDMEIADGARSRLWSYRMGDGGGPSLRQ